MKAGHCEPTGHCGAGGLGCPGVKSWQWWLLLRLWRASVVAEVWECATCLLWGGTSHPCPLSRPPSWTEQEAGPQTVRSAFYSCLEALSRG